jgi:hypothetical protein
MTIVIDGTTGISPVTASGTSASVDGMTVGRGGGEVSTNTAVGASALNANSAGTNDTAIGYRALYLNTGNSNTAIGSYAAFNNAGGASVVAVGRESLYGNTSGNYNVAVGDNALSSNTTASNNTAVGYQAGYTQTTAGDSTYLGYTAGKSVTTAYGNLCVGAYAGRVVTTGAGNCIVGTQAGFSLTTGAKNTFIGSSDNSTNFSAGYYVTTGSSNSILGNFSGNSGGLDIRTASNYIVLSDGDGNPRLISDSGGSITVGGNIGGTQKGYLNIQGAANVQTNLYLFKNTQVEAHFGFISGSSSNLYVNTGATIGTTGVYLTNGGTSWTSNSDERLKENLVPITDGLSKVSTLRSVIGNFIADENKTPRPFLIAQDVQAVLPQAVSISEINGTEYLGVSYTEVIPLLVAAIKELKAEFDAYKATHP